MYDIMWLNFWTKSNSHLSFRYSRISKPSANLYITSTAVFVAEGVKLGISVIMCFVIDCNQSIREFRNMLKLEFVDESKEFFKLFIPSGLYVIQNNLLYIATSNLPADVYQVLYQMKVITTAFFSVVMLNRKISVAQWSSVATLAIGDLRVWLTVSHCIVIILILHIVFHWWHLCVCTYFAYFCGLL